MELATNKMLTTVLLHKNNIKSPITAMCETSELAMKAFFDLDGDIVLKPLYGSRGRDIIRINSEQHARFVFEQLENFDVFTFKILRDDNSDYRLFAVGDGSSL